MSQFYWGLLTGVVIGSLTGVIVSFVIQEIREDIFWRKNIVPFLSDKELKDLEKGVEIIRGKIYG